MGIRRGFFYLLDFVTSTEIFQIGDGKKKKKKKKKKDIDSIYCNSYIVYGN